MGTARVRKFKRRKNEEEHGETELQVVETAKPQVTNSDLEDAFHLHGHEEDNEEIWLISYADLMTLLVAFFAMLLSFSKIDPNEFEKVKEEATKAFGGQYQVPFKDLADSMKAVMDKNGLRDKVFIEQTAEGITINFKGNLLFDSGKVELHKQAEGLLDDVIPAVIEQAKGFSVVVEGHTDSVAIEEGIIKSNWELLGLRAAAVARKFLSSNFPNENIRIEGYADTVKLVDTKGLKLEQLSHARAMNRRVVVRIKKNF